MHVDKELTDKFSKYGDNKVCMAYKLVK